MMYKRTFFVGIIALGMYALAPFHTSAAEQTCTNFTVETDGNPATAHKVCHDTSASTVTPPSPPTTSAEGFSRRGIFGCNDTGAYSMSVGTLGAMGGAFVPVNDAAVTLNTGTLVYKECVLREEVNRQRENAIANIEKDTNKNFLTGREGGKALYPVKLDEDKLARSDEVADKTLNGPALDAIDPALRDPVKRTIARNYAAQTDGSNQMLKCAYNGDLKALIEARQFSWGGLMALSNPVCNPLGAFNVGQAKMMSDIASQENDMLTQLGWGNGVYGVEKIDADGTRRVVTPPFAVAEAERQVLGSGLRQQENANDIGQMIGSLFSRISVSILASSGGLEGLIQGTAGSPSYLDQVVLDSSAGLRDSAINAGIQILVAARQVGAQYLEAENGTSGALQRAIAQLRGAEASCWNIIVPKVKDYAQVGPCTKNPDKTQTCTGSFALKIATSTAFSQQVIDSQIAPLATTTAQKINSSELAVAAVDKLIAGVTNSNDPSVQSAALQQLDALVAQKVLPSQYDLKAAEQQLQDANNSISNLVTDTIKAWGDSKDPNVGWCNVNSAGNDSDGNPITPPVVKMLADKWRI